MSGSFTVPVTLSNSINPVCLLDSNILLRWLRRDDPRHGEVRTAINTLLDGGVSLVYAMQGSVEVYNVLTRPADKNGYGLACEDARQGIKTLETAFERLPENDAVYAIWMRLIVDHKVSGVQVHDTRIAAIMLANDVVHLLTYNGSDFRRFVKEGLMILSPAGT